MANQLRNIYVTELAENARHLSGARFEEFGYRVMEVLYPGLWTHRGTTSEGAPVGHVVDSSANGARWVAQYSSEKGYFDGKLDKLNKDLLSTTTKHPQVEHLWMFSNNECGPSQVTDVQNWIDTQARSGRNVRVLDVRDIVTEIYERLDNDKLVESAGPFLPYLPKIRDMWALSHKVPSFANYVTRAAEEDDLTKRLHDHRIAAASGMSGYGKSAIASAVATKLRNQFDSIFWLDSKNIRTVDALKHVDALQNGQKYNILGVAKRSRCLLILDDLKVSLPQESLLGEIGSDSAVLITTQYSFPNATIVSGIGEAAARRILDTDVATACPDDIFREIFAKTSGHPLLLSAMNRIASEDSPPNWTQVGALCSSPTDVEDANHSPLHDRILNHHLQAARLPIAAIAWLGAPGFDPSVLSRLAGPNAERVLSSRHLLTAAGPGLGRVHDLAFAAMSRVTSTSAEESTKMRDVLCDYLSELILENRVELHRVSTVHRALIYRLMQQATHPSLRYAYALPRAPDTDLVVLGDPFTFATQYAQQGRGSELEIRALIECIEARYSIANRSSKESGQETLRADGLALDALVKVPSLRGRMAIDIAHHRAKLLLWQGKSTEAENRFSELLSVNPEHSAARLQLGRLLVRKYPPDTDGAIAQAQYIIELPADLCSDTVMLGAFALLLGDKGRAILRSRASQFAALLSRTASVGLDQAYDVLATLARDLWYHDPDLFQRLADALPNRLAAPASDRDWFAWAQLRKSLAKARFDGGASPAEVRPLLDEARDSYAAMSRMTPFELVQAAECSILLFDSKDALDLLNKVEFFKREVHWHHRRAQALCLDGKLDDAVEEIERCLEDPSANRYASAFLEERWKIKEARGDADAIDSLRQAVAASPTESKFGIALRERLVEAEARHTIDAGALRAHR